MIISLPGFQQHRPNNSDFGRGQRRLGGQDQKHNFAVHGDAQLEFRILGSVREKPPEGPHEQWPPVSVSETHLQSPLLRALLVRTLQPIP